MTKEQFLKWVQRGLREHMIVAVSSISASESDEYIREVLAGQVQHVEQVSAVARKLAEEWKL